MRRSHHHLLLLLCAGEDREETAPRGGAGGGGGLPCPGRGPASHKQALGAQDTRVQFQIKARHVRVAAPCQAQMANDVPDLQAQGGHRASSAVALGLLCPPTPSAHQASSRLLLLGAPDSAASPLALHPRRTCLPSEGEGERGSGEGCPHPTVASAEEPSLPPGPGHSPPGRRPCWPFRHPQTVWGRAPSPSVQGQARPSPICQPPRPCPISLPVPRQSLRSGPALAPQPPAPPRAPASAPAAAWPLPSWPECSRCSCRSHPNTRSFEQPFFFPFCRDFMAGAAGLWPSLRPLSPSPYQCPMGSQAGLRAWPGPRVEGALEVGSGSCLWSPGHTEVAVEEEAARTLARSCVSWPELALALLAPLSPGGGQEAVQLLKPASC